MEDGIDPPVLAGARAMGYQPVPSGFEYDLAVLFARALHAKPVFVVTDNPAKIDRLLREKQAHLAAAALPRHFEFPGGLAWGPPDLTTQHEIVGHGTTNSPGRLA